jgi:hypothetical protein
MVLSRNPTLEHIAGVKNIIEAGRLCANYMKDLPKEFTSEDIYVSALFQDFKIPDDKYELIAKVHNTLAGHHGVDRTINRLRSYWHLILLGRTYDNM